MFTECNLFFIKFIVDIRWVIFGTSLKFTALSRLAPFFITVKHPRSASTTLSAERGCYIFFAIFSFALFF